MDSRPSARFPNARGAPVASDGRMVFDGKRMRKPVVRKTVDYFSSTIETLQRRFHERDVRDRWEMEPTLDYLPLCIHRYPDNPSQAYTTKFVTLSVNKVKHPVNSLVWTLDAKRLITGAHSGEVTLWNGLTFNFETILQAHDHAIRVLRWSHDGKFMLSADDRGVIKYWQPSLNNVKAFTAHRDGIRALSFAPSDRKFASASDDQMISIWDFDTCQCDVQLEGHGDHVRAVDWNPFKALIVSGSKDCHFKLWDPRKNGAVASQYAHNSALAKVCWASTGQAFVTGARDNLIKLWDIRNLKEEVRTFRSHKKEITALAWHPHYETLFASGSFDGVIHFWHCNETESPAEICGAHDQAVWDMAWHPLGHMLATASNDGSTRFWTRNRPGDEMTDKYNANQLPPEEKLEAITALIEISKQDTRKFQKLHPDLLSEVENAQIKLDTTTGEAMFIPGLGSASEALARKDQIKLEPSTSSVQQARERDRDRERDFDRGRGYSDVRQRDRDYGRKAPRDRETEFREFETSRFDRRDNRQYPITQSQPLSQPPLQQPQLISVEYATQLFHHVQQQQGAAPRQPTAEEISVIQRMYAEQIRQRPS